MDKSLDNQEGFSPDRLCPRRTYGQPLNAQLGSLVSSFWANPYCSSFSSEISEFSIDGKIQESHPEKS